MKLKMPPYGKTLQALQQHGQKPSIIAVCAGLGAVETAKIWQKLPQSWGIAIPPAAQIGLFAWPVDGCLCLVEWNHGPAHPEILNIVKTLLFYGAGGVILRRCWIDTKTPLYTYDLHGQNGQRLVKNRDFLLEFHNVEGAEC